LLVKLGAREAETVSRKRQNRVWAIVSPTTLLRRFYDQERINIQLSFSETARRGNTEHYLSAHEKLFEDFKSVANR
jgi:hypothetical protein